MSALSNLPPGVTDAMIEGRNEGECDICGDTFPLEYLTIDEDGSICEECSDASDDSIVEEEDEL